MEGIISERKRRQSWLFDHPRIYEALLFALIAMATSVAVLSFEHSLREDEKAALDRKAAEVSAAIERRATENIAYLSAAGKLFSAKQNISRQSFGQFVRDLASGNEERGAVGMGWARWLQRSELRAYLAEIRKDQREFSVRPNAGLNGPPLAVITLLEPQTPDNLSAMGFDMNSETVRRSGLTIAARTRQATVSGLVHLVQDAGYPERAGFLIYVPVFSDGDNTDLRGFIYSPFRAGTFLASAMTLLGEEDGLKIALYDDHEGAGRLLAGSAIAEPDALIARRVLQVGNRRWILHVTEEREYGLSPISVLVILFGLMLSALLIFISRLQTARASEDRRVIEVLQSEAGIRASLTRELHHRVKNTLANVLSIVALTKRRYDNVPDFAESLTARIQALSATHDLLVKSEWRHAEVNQIVRSELAPFMVENAGIVELSGPEVTLAPNEALSLGLALHELATNAAKYGALGAAEGKVIVSWALTDNQTMELNWREQGGPTVVAPSRRGFGLELIERVVSHELKSPARIEFNPGGVMCTLKVPVRTRSDFAIRAESGAE